jgi:hypothetical protein
VLSAKLSSQVSAATRSPVCAVAARIGSTKEKKHADFKEAHGTLKEAND